MQLSSDEDDEPETGSHGLMPPPQRSPFGWVVLVLVIVALAAGGRWYQRSQVGASAPEVQALPVPAPPDEAGVGAALAPAGRPPSSPMVVVAASDHSSYELK